MDILANPFVVALLALLGVPAVASFLTTVLLKAGGAGLKPQTVVYVVCAIIVTLVTVLGGSLPLIDAANPVATMAAWMMFVAGLGKLTEALYDVVFKKLWPSPPTP